MIPLSPFLFAMKWWDQMPWSSFYESWVLCQLFHSPLSPSSRGSLVPLHFPIRVVSSAYLRLLIFLLAMLVQVCDSFSSIFHMMYTEYKLNKQGDNIQPCHTPFPILNQSVFPYPVLTVVSWLAYRFHRRQVRWSGIPISKNFPQFVVIHTVKSLSLVNETEANVFLEILCFLYGPTNVCSFISGSSAPFETQAVHLKVPGSCIAEA